VNISGSSLLSVAANSASGGDGADTLSNFENIIGSAFNDILIGNGSNNSFDGGAGDDTLVGGAGADAFIGGLGIDTVSYVNASSGVNMTLDNSLAQTNDAAGDTFLSIENIIGTAFGDTLYGDNINNTIIGGQGNDVLAGRDGNDILDVSEGRDTAYGDGGDDIFIVNVASNNTPNYIHGGSDLNSFNLGGDTIRLTGLTSGQNYSLSTIANVTDFVEIVDIRDTINSTLTLGSNDVQNIMNQGNGANLFIKADSGDTLNLSLNADQTMSSFNVHNGTSYVIYTGSTQVAAVHWQTA
jgi:Ca2+-binding RTX toxin-like protein